MSFYKPPKGKHKTDGTPVGKNTKSGVNFKTWELAGHEYAQWKYQSFLKPAG
jgi:hypothetical protein